MRSFSLTWLDLLHMVMATGKDVSPRGMLTRELMQYTIQVNMRKPVLTVPLRKINYKFMAAEAYWILTGDNRVETIAPYNKNIANFSDDGETFFGAYGPKIVDQIPYVVNKLMADPDSRQAGLIIWRESPPQTKDVPCTVAIFFNIRTKDGKRYLNANVFMRSNDVWLGTPYDVFNFCMLGHFVCGYLNKMNGIVGSVDAILPGKLFLTAASMHLYDSNWEDANICIRSARTRIQPDTPEPLYLDPADLISWLRDLRETSPGHELRWWEAKDNAPQP